MVISHCSVIQKRLENGYVVSSSPLEDKSVKCSQKEYNRRENFCHKPDWIAIVNLSWAILCFCQQNKHPFSCYATKLESASKLTTLCLQTFK